MKNVPDNVNIAQLNIPGVHNAATQFCRFSLFSKCQSISIKEMLNMGVRAFDLRVNGEVLVHSFSKCKKTRFGKALKIYDVIKDFYDFLSQYSTETLFVFFKNDGKISGEKCLDTLIKDIINKDRDKWYLENKFPDMLQVRGKIILVNRINCDLGLNFSAMPYQGNEKEFEEVFSPEGVNTVFVQDRYKLSCKAKWENAVKPFLINKKDKGVVLNHLSTAGIPFIPKLNACYINRKFVNFDLKLCDYYGIIMADFIDGKISEKIIKTNFNKDGIYENKKL